MVLERDPEVLEPPGELPHDDGVPLRGLTFDPDLVRGVGPDRHGVVCVGNGAHRGDRDVHVEVRVGDVAAGEALLGRPCGELEDGKGDELGGDPLRRRSLHPRVLAGAVPVPDRPAARLGRGPDRDPGDAGVLLHPLEGLADGLAPGVDDRGRERRVVLVDEVRHHRLRRGVHDVDHRRAHAALDPYLAGLPIDDLSISGPDEPLAVPLTVDEVGELLAGHLPQPEPLRVLPPHLGEDDGVAVTLRTLRVPAIGVVLGAVVGVEARKLAFLEVVQQSSGAAGELPGCRRHHATARVCEDEDARRVGDVRPIYPAASAPPSRSSAGGAACTGQPSPNPSGRLRQSTRSC